MEEEESETRGSKVPQAEGTRIKEDVDSVEGKANVDDSQGRRNPDAEKGPDRVGLVDDLEEARTLPWLELAKLLDRLITAVSPGYSKEGDKDAMSMIDEVIEILAAITEQNSSLPEEVKKTTSERIATENGEVLQVLSGFMKQLYSSHMNGLEMLCLIHVQNCLILWSHYSSAICKQIVDKKILFWLIMELHDLPYAHTSQGPGQELLTAVISTALTVLLNCIERVELHHHFENCNATDIIIPYVRSGVYSLATTAKVCLALLYKQLDPTQANQYLQLTSEQVEAILLTLAGETTSEKSSESEDKQYWSSLSSAELAYVLKHFITVDENCHLFAKHQTAASNALQCQLQSKDGSLQKLSLEILWRFLLSPRYQQSSSELLAVTALLHVVSSSSFPDLETLSSCVLLAADGDLPEDAAVYLKYIRTSYTYELYSECIRICDTALSKPFEHQLQLEHNANLLKGKALCHIFSRELASLRKMSSSAKGFRQRRKSCCMKVKEAICSLGNAHDNDCIDKEGSRLLDYAMMIYLSEPGNLKGLRRCLLCHGKGKLMRSHICPKAVLDDFAKSAGTPDSHKAFFLNWPWQKHLTGYVKSPGEMTIWMLCTTCETILSKDESMFLPHFFRKIYNKANPASIMQEQEISYSAWLYRFCAGLLFRGIALQYTEGWDSYINAHEVHEMFCRLRAVLLATDAQLKMQQTPAISLFLLPVEADSSEADSVLINSVIHYIFHFFFTHKQVLYSSHQMYKQKLFFSFKLGIVMTTVQFPSASEYAISSEQGLELQGVFKVPVADSRRQTIPDPIWETLLVEATQLENEVSEQSKRMTKIPMERLLSVPQSSYMVDILSIATQSRSFGQASPIAGVPKVVNLLPQVIEVKHHFARVQTGSLTLPERHTVILHLDSQTDSGNGDTVFLVIGSDNAEYCPQNPYVIWHHYESGLQHNIGFHFSPESYGFVDFVPDADPKRYTQSNLQNLVKVSNKIITTVLSQRGFRSYQSLQHWLKSKKGPWSLDMKCKGVKMCWYCENLCEVCMQSTNFGPTVTSKSGSVTPLRFCSQECAQMYTTTPEPHAQVFSPQRQQTGTMNVPCGHKEYLRLYTHGQLETECFMASMSICEGDGSPTFPAGRFYVMFCQRTENSQCHLEFFITNDLQAAETITYTNQPDSLFEEEEEIDIKGAVMSIISGVFGRSHCSTLQEFLAYLPLSEVFTELSDLLAGTILLPSSPSSSGMNSQQEASDFSSGGSQSITVHKSVLIPPSTSAVTGETADEVGSSMNTSSPATESDLIEQQLRQLLAGVLAQTAGPEFADSGPYDSAKDNKCATDMREVDNKHPISQAASTEIQDTPTLQQQVQHQQQKLPLFSLAQHSTEISLEQREGNKDSKVASSQLPEVTEQPINTNEADVVSKISDVEDSIELPKNEDESPCLVS